MNSNKEKAAGVNQTAVENTHPYNAVKHQTSQAENPLLSAALDYGTKGYAVHPVRGKIPITPHGCKDASTDAAIISAWWQKWPKADVAIAAGSLSGFWVLDIDGEQGEASIRELEKLHGLLPPTLEVITGGGGRHLYFTMPSDIKVPNSVKSLSAGLDVRSDGGYVVAPPSLHATGKRYEWSVDSAESIAAAPEWLLNLIQAPRRENSKNESANWMDFVDGTQEGKRNDSLASFAGKLLRADITPPIVLETCRAFNSRCTPPLPDDEVIRTVSSISKMERNRRQSENTDSEMEIICMDNVEMQQISWLWPSRIAQGKLTLIAGDPGLGKSQMTAYLAAAVSAEKGWHGMGEIAPKGSVIFLSAEDDPADTIKPRLLAAGANVKLCHVINAIKTKDREGKKGIRSFDLTKDIQRLGQALRKIGNVKLVIIDPISAYLGKTDSHNNADMRGLLAPLSDLAMRYNVAIVLLTHLNKSTQQDFIGRVIGSIGLIAAVRAGYAVIKDEQSPETRYFVPIKNNIGNDKDGFAFHIEPVTIAGGFETSRVCLHEDVVDAQKVLYPEAEQKPGGTTGAKHFLRDLLAEQPMLTKDIFDHAEGAGYSKPSIQRASRNLNIKRTKLGMDGGWQWSLGSSTPEDATLKNVSSSTPSQPSAIKQGDRT